MQTVTPTKESTMNVIKRAAAVIAVAIIATLSVASTASADVTRTGTATKPGAGHDVVQVAPRVRTVPLPVPVQITLGYDIALRNGATFYATLCDVAPKVGDTIEQVRINCHDDAATS